MKFARTLTVNSALLSNLQEKRIGFQISPPAVGKPIAVTSEGCERYTLHPPNTVLSMGAFSYSDGFMGQLQASRVKIGRYCSIAAGARTLTTNHPAHFVSSHPFQYSKSRYSQKDFFDLPEDYSAPSEFDHNTAPIEIGNDVWIGMSVTIMGGVKIGNGAIIAAGAYVTKDVPPYEIFGGVSAKKIGSRFPAEIVDELQHLQWWNYHYRDLKDVQWSDPTKAISHLRVACASAEPLQDVMYDLKDL